MQLNQPIPPPFSGGENPYDFILNGNQQIKKGRLPLPKANNRKQRIMYVLGGGLLLVVVLMVLFTLLTSGSKGSTETMLNIAQTQNELIRISTIGSAASRDITTQAFAENTQAVLTTGQQQTIKYLTSHGLKVKAKQLGLRTNTKTDASLKLASETGHYDEELNIVLTKQLTDYQTEVKTAYKASGEKAQKTLLELLFNQVSTLLKNQSAISS